MAGDHGPRRRAQGALFHRSTTSIAAMRGYLRRRRLELHEPAPTRSEDQRNGDTCDGRSTGLRAEAAAGRGAGADILSRMSCSAACTLVISTASLSTLCRTKSRLAGAAAIVSSLVASRSDCQAKVAATP